MMGSVYLCPITLDLVICENTTIHELWATKYDYEY